MITLTLSGIAQFLQSPMAALERMRETAPGVQAGVLALCAATFVMVVIDFAYGPYAFPHTLEPGGKRDATVYFVAFVETARIFGVASIILIGTRHFLRAQVTVAEVLWMTVPYGLALIAFELVQLLAWLIVLGAGLNFYGQFFLLGFLGSCLILVASIRTLTPDRDWLAVLPLAAAAFVFGTFFAPIVLLGTAVYLAVRGARHRN
ncbi:hypothetical protein [Nioella aestuarii]|uniref:hypothetical protein n=1 Tax=Nioella aestuarii TaxID=1662864 RepID=UPI003D7F6C0D